MKISLHNDKLLLSFHYDPRLVDVVRALPGRSYDKSKKQWCVPMIHGARVIEKLAPWGFSVDPEIEELIQDEKDRIEKSLGAQQRIKNNPDRFVTSLPLHNFQKLGATFLAYSRGALLADSPGLGKTIQTIASLQDESKRILVLCPASLKDNWFNEIIKWTHEAATGVIGGNKKERINQWSFPYRWMIANYELLLHDFEAISKIPWDAIVCDEATRISNGQAKTVKRLKKLQAKRRIALTGTPISNSPHDLWSIIDWLEPGYLGTFPQFFERYTKSDFYGNVVGYQNMEELKGLIAPFVLRRTKEEVLTGFPAKTVQDIFFELSPAEKKIYAGVKNELIAQLGSSIDKIDPQTLAMMPVKMLRLKQVTDHPGLIGDYCGERSKCDALVDLLEPIISSGEKAIVFSQFAKMADLLMVDSSELVPKATWYCIQGSTPVSERQKIVDAFNTHIGGAVLVMTEAGAYGLNIQAASYVIHYDAPWSIAKLDQREGRAHRMGQQKPVTVYNLIAKDTIDEYVAKVLHNKSTVSVDILGDDERLRDAGLTEEDIKNILRI